MQPAPLIGPGDLYLALGDSLTAGIGATRPTERGFPALLQPLVERQAGHPVPLVNLGVPRETTVSFLTGGQFDAALEVIANARSSGRRVSPITISLGANDLLQSAEDDAAREQAMTAVATNLRAIYAQLRTATADAAGNPTTDLFTITYYDPSASDPSQPGTDAWWLSRLNTIVVDETSRAGGRTADVAAAFRGHESDWTWFPIDIHPTNAGHEAIARTIWRITGYDTTPPSVGIVRPEAGPLPRPVPTVVVLATDQIGVVELTLWINGQQVGPIPYLPALDRYETLWDTRSSPAGAHTLEARAVDAAGNVGTATVTVEVVPELAPAPRGSQVAPATPAP